MSYRINRSLEKRGDEKLKGINNLNPLVPYNSQLYYSLYELPNSWKIA